MPTKKDPYAVLGVPASATEVDVKKAYRQLALKWHPDKHVADSNQAEATKRFKEISEAYQILSDKSRRRDYDGGNVARPTSGAAKEQQRQDKRRNPPKSGKTAGSDGYNWEWSWFDEEQQQQQQQEDAGGQKRRQRRGRDDDSRTFDAAFEEMERAFDVLGGTGERRRRGGAAPQDSPPHVFTFKDPFALFDEFFGGETGSDPFSGLFATLMSNPRNQERIRDELRAEGRGGRRAEDRERRSGHDGRREKNVNINNNAADDDRKLRKSGGKRRDAATPNNVFTFPDPFHDNFFKTAFRDALNDGNNHRDGGGSRRGSAASRPGSSSRRQLTSTCRVGGKTVVTKRIVDAKGERIVVEIDGVVTSDTLNGQPAKG